MRDALFALVMVPTLVSILAAPHIGIIVWHLFSLMNPHRFTWSMQNVPWAIMIAGMTMLSWALSRERKWLPLTPVTFFLVLFMGWLSVTTLAARLPDIANASWEQAMKIMFMALVGIPLINSRERLQAMMWAAAVALGFHGVKGGLFALATGGQFRVHGPPASFIGDNNDLALALVMTLPLILYLYETTERPVLRWGLLATAGLTLLATVFTYSRGGLLGLAVVTLLLVLRSRRRILILLAAAFLAVELVPLLPEHWLARMGTIGEYESDPSAVGRLMMWRMATGIALDNPVFGGGFKVFLDPSLYPVYLPESNTVRDVHSAYFQVLGEHGFVGLAIFLMLGLAAARSAWWVRRRARPWPELQWARRMAAMLLISLAGYAVSAAFLTLAFYDYLYFELAVIASLRLYVARRLAELERARPSPPLGVSSGWVTGGASSAT